MKKLTYQFKAFLLARAKSQARKKIKRNKRFRTKRLAAGSSYYIESLASQKRTIEEHEKEERSKIYKFNPESEFSIIENTKNVISFIYRLKQYAKKRFNGYKFQINLEDIKTIDIGAICILLSTIKELSYYGIEVSSTIPSDSACKKKLTESGYMAHVRSMAGTIEEPKNKNIILIKGKDRTKNKDVGETIRLAVEMITGAFGHFPPIFSIIQEINGNSIEHAYESKRKEHWLLSITHDIDQNKVIFTFADNGVGILNTLRRKLTQRFFESFQLYTDAKILEGAFTKNYSSRHEYQINRNKGLPLIKRILTENQTVKNLFVITNKVFLYINDYKSVPIDKEFSGTFYYWELDQECIDRWKARKTS